MIRRVLSSVVLAACLASSWKSLAFGQADEVQAPTPAELAALFPVVHSSFTYDDSKRAERVYMLPIQMLVVNEDFVALEAACVRAANDHAPWAGGRHRYVALFDNLVVPNALHLRSNKARSEFCTRWLAAVPNSVTAAALRIDAQMSYAWEARGSGFAYKVTDDGWRLFGERMKPIAGWIEEAEKQPIDNPLYFAQAIDYAKAAGQPHERVDDLIERSARAPIKTHRPFLAATAYYLPRWQGGPGDLERYAQRVYELTKADRGAEVYSQIVVTASSYHGAAVFTDFKFSWPLVARGFCDHVRRAPGSGFEAGQFVRMACYAKERETARVLFEHLGDDGVRFWRGDIYNQNRAWARRDATAIGKTLFEFGNWVRSLAWGPGDDELYVADGEALHFVDLKSGEKSVLMPVKDAVFFDRSADGNHLVVVTDEGAALLADLKQRTAEPLFSSPNDLSFESVRFTPQGRIVARDEAGTLYSWRVEGDRDQQTFAIPDRPAACEALSPDGAGWLTKAKGNEGLALWDLASGTLKQQWLLPKPAAKRPPAAPLPRVYVPRSIVVSPDGKLVLGSARGVMRIWNYGEESPRGEVEFGDGGVAHAVFTLDGRLLTAMWRNKALRDGDPTSYAECESEILLWDLKELKVVKKYDGHEASVAWLALAPDGKRFASASHDRTVRIWTLP